MANPKHEVLRESEAAEQLRVSSWTLRRLVRDGAIPAPVRITPGRVGYLRADIQTYIDSCVAEARQARPAA